MKTEDIKRAFEGQAMRNAELRQENLANAQLDGGWSHSGQQAGSCSSFIQKLMASGARGIRMEVVPPDFTPTPAICTPDFDEESRLATEQNMLAFHRVRVFMERVMPIEWCHERYPKVYVNQA